MRPYLRVLGKTDFRRLWTGATVSTLGDGMTFVALSPLSISSSAMQRSRQPAASSPKS
jgi:hypothetical protein